MVICDETKKGNIERGKYMQEMSLEEVKQVQIDLLNDLAQVCRQHNLRYYLTGGTLLGAVKYQGFIPWDDDIDLALPRPDFMKLIDILEKRNHSRYKMLSIYHNKDMYYPFGKYVDTQTVEIETAKPITDYGVYLDVYPIDGVPEKKQDKFLKKINLYKNFSYARWESKNTLHTQFSFSKKEGKQGFLHNYKDSIRKVFNVVTKPLGFQFWVRLLDKQCQSYAFDEAKYIGVICHRYTPKQIFLKEQYIEQALYSFEGSQHTATKQADAYLTQIYGDYKKDPPVEEQKTHHEFKAYWKKEAVEK